MESNLKEVYYETYCHNCKHCLAEESAEPCCDCLNQPVNENSHKPVYFEEE